MTCGTADYRFYTTCSYIPCSIQQSNPSSIPFPIPLFHKSPKPHCTCSPIYYNYADELKKRGYFNRVKQQIVQMYEEGNKVTLVAHSMGAPTTLYFLNTENGIVTQEWKDQYIHAYVTLSGAWAGSPRAVEEIVSGNNFGLPGMIYDKFFRDVSRSLESVVWLFPYSKIFGNESTIVSTPSKNYTAKNFTTLFKDIDHPNGSYMYEGVKKINEEIPDPKVRTHCYWGLGTPTPSSYHYDKEFPVDVGYDAKTYNSNGDGYVNEIASKACLLWPNTTTVEHKTFEGVDHFHMVKNNAIFEAVANVVKNVPAKGTVHQNPMYDKRKGGMIHDTGYHGFTKYNAIRRMIRKMVQMMVRI